MALASLFSGLKSPIPKNFARSISIDNFRNRCFLKESASRRTCENEALTSKAKPRSSGTFFKPKGKIKFHANKNTTTRR